MGAEIDGEIGPETLGKAPPPDRRNARALRRGAPPALPLDSAIFWRFGKGWLARVDRTLAAATVIAAATGSPPPGGEGLGVGGTPTAEILHPTTPSQPKETTPMPDATRTRHPASRPPTPNGGASR